MEMRALRLLQNRLLTDAAMVSLDTYATKLESLYTLAVNCSQMKESLRLQRVMKNDNLTYATCMAAAHRCTRLRYFEGSRCDMHYAKLKVYNEQSTWCMIILMFAQAK